MKYYEVSAFCATTKIHRNVYVFADNEKTAFVYAMAKFKNDTAMFIFTPFIFEWIGELLAKDVLMSESRLHSLVYGATNVSIYIDELVEMP